MDFGELELWHIVVAGIVLILVVLVPLYRRLRSKWGDYWQSLS